jgi:hypothetical protein
MVYFYEFMAVLDDVRVKVIVKEVAGGGEALLEHHPVLEIR